MSVRFAATSTAVVHEFVLERTDSLAVSFSTWAVVLIASLVDHSLRGLQKAACVCAAVGTPPRRQPVTDRVFEPSLLREKRVRLETLRLLKGVGVELEQASFLNTQRSFIDLEHVEQILITEVIQSTDVHVCLAFVLKHQQDLVVAFPNLRPGLRIVKEIYETLQNAG